MLEGEAPASGFGWSSGFQYSVAVLEGGSWKWSSYVQRILKDLNGSCLYTLCNLSAFTESIASTENAVTERLDVPEDKQQLQEVKCSNLLAGWEEARLFADLPKLATLQFQTVVTQVEHLSVGSDDSGGVTALVW